MMNTLKQASSLIFTYYNRAFARKNTNNKKLTNSPEQQFHSFLFMITFQALHSFHILYYEFTNNNYKEFLIFSV